MGVIGAGAIGCYVGGRLHAGGADVVLVGRESGKRAVEEHGLTLVGIDGETAALGRVRFETDAAALADRDIVLCAVKSSATEETAERLDAVLAKRAIVVSLQNGLRAAETLRACARETLASVVGFNVVSKGDGVFRQATSGKLVIESSPDPRVTELVAALAAAGFESSAVKDIRRVQWAKLLVNLNNAVSALSGAPTKEIVLSAGYRRILAAVIREALDVLGAARIRPANLTGLPMWLFPLALSLPTPIVRIVARAQLKIDPEARSSMWEDLVKRRKTEVDDLNGEIVRLAESCGLEAPLNRRVVALVHEAEREAKGSPGLAASVLAARLGV
ncbi:MAG TPA: 2-dehydropantoate 2-reductase [Labilithrix sp.]